MSEASSVSATVSVLFVCLGNICRSPLAEGVFREMAEQQGLGELLRVDSAGTGAWHVGEPPDPRSRKVASANGIELEGRARQVEPADLDDFDWVVAMDADNERDVRHLGAGRDFSARVLRLRELDPEADGDLDVPDPYYGGADGFDRVYAMVERSCRVLLERIVAELDAEPES